MSTEVVDPHGDLHLFVGSDITFQICSRTLARSSRVFDTMLYGPWAESCPGDRKVWTASLPEDSPDAMRFLLDLIHNPWRNFPDPPALRHELYDLLVLIDKYDLGRLFRPFASRWRGKVEMSTTLRIPRLPNRQPNLANIHERLWISFALGATTTFRELFSTTVLHCQMDSNQNSSVYDQIASSPLGAFDLVGIMHKAREASITAIVEDFRKIHQALGDDKYDKALSLEHKCSLNYFLFDSVNTCDFIDDDYEEETTRAKRDELKSVITREISREGLLPLFTGSTCDTSRSMAGLHDSFQIVVMRAWQEFANCDNEPPSLINFCKWPPRASYQIPEHLEEQMDEERSRMGF